MIDALLRDGFRVAETALVLGQTGLLWMLGHRPPAPALLRETFERLGTTYIKLGQFIASTPSLFPPEYVEEFQQCLDRTTPIPFEKIRQILREEYGRDPLEVFAHIDEAPLASASIAQVHEARLPDGQIVVLKVQKPGVQDIILTDMHFLVLASHLLEWFVPDIERTSLSAMLEDLQKTMAEECDFLHEARNIREFRAFLTRGGITQATAPTVYDALTTRRVLVMERLYGVPLTDLDAIRSRTADPAQTLIQALNVWLVSLVACDFFHADVHAGNLLVLDDGRIGFIDFGIVGRIDPAVWNGMEGFVVGLQSKDATAVARALMHIGATDETVDETALAEDLGRVFDRMRSLETRAFEHGSIDEADIHRLVMAISQVGQDHGLRFPREFLLLIKQLLYFDRYVRLLAPGLNMLNDERLLRPVTDAASPQQRA